MQVPGISQRPNAEEGRHGVEVPPSYYFTFNLVVTNVLFYRPCYDRHALGHEDHPECCCDATFPFLPSTRRLLDGVDFVLLNLSSFDVDETWLDFDESCDEGNRR